MRIYKYLFFLVLPVMAACHGEDRVPDNIISMERMPVIISDIQIVDGDLSTVPQDQDSLYKYGMGNYLAIFKKYHTDTTQFRKSYTWYTKHPFLLDSISSQVITILQKKNDSISKIKVPPVKSTAANPANTPVTPANAVPAK